ncbi:hypothetical protein GW17_00041044 [Ensete ventricosum]|nr:hypothetical protein GW17_00041044 [Ensete ventricosum]
MADLTWVGSTRHSCSEQSAHLTARTTDDVEEYDGMVSHRDNKDLRHERLVTLIIKAPAPLRSREGSAHEPGPAVPTQQTRRHRPRLLGRHKDFSLSLRKAELTVVQNTKIMEVVHLLLQLPMLLLILLEVGLNLGSKIDSSLLSYLNYRRIESVLQLPDLTLEFGDLVTHAVDHLARIMNLVNQGHGRPTSLKRSTRYPIGQFSHVEHLKWLALGSSSHLEQVLNRPPGEAPKFIPKAPHLQLSQSYDTVQLLVWFDRPSHPLGSYQPRMSSQSPPQDYPRMTLRPRETKDLRRKKKKKTSRPGG